MNMINHQGNSKTSCVVQGNCISVNRLDHPICVSAFTKCLNFFIQKGNKEIKIVFKDNIQVYPNACVPIAGIIQHFQSNGIKFNTFINSTSYLRNCHFSSPYSSDNGDEFDSACGYPMDKIFRFSSGLQIGKLTQSYVNTISGLVECEDGVLDSISWCISEVMDNVLTHSEAGAGLIMAQYHQKTNHIAFCIYDSGIGIHKTLCHTKHHPRSEIDSLTLALQEGVGDGKGQGNGLYGLFQSIIQNNGRLSLTSGESSIMLTNNGAIKKYENLPLVSQNNKQTIVDFQINLKRRISFKTIFSSIDSSWEIFDPRIDSMLSEDDDFIHYNVFDYAQGTGTREAGSQLRNDVINILKRENRRIILDFSNIQTVSSSFIDEFIAKLVIQMGFIRFNNIVLIKNMNENVSFLCERSLYMRIYDEWSNRSIAES